MGIVTGALAVGKFLWPYVKSAVTNFGPSALAVYGGMRQNEANARMAREQMEFQERMSSTSIQRGIADARAAGLNPALGFGGASSPSGASAVMGDPIASGISTAMQSRLFRENLRAASATVDKAEAEAFIADAESAPYRSVGAKAGLQKYVEAVQAEWEAKAATAREAVDAQIAATRASAEASSAGAANAQAQNKRLEAEAEMYSSEFGKLLPWLEALVPNAAVLGKIAPAFRMSRSSPGRISPVRPGSGVPRSPSGVSRARQVSPRDPDFRRRLDSVARANVRKPPAVGKLDSLLGRRAP